jgi:hypothetical protein
MAEDSDHLSLAVLAQMRVDFNAARTLEYLIVLNAA